MKDILKIIREEIEIVDKPENRLDYQRFFKEQLKERYRIKTAIVRKVSNKCYNEVRELPKDEILDICDELLESDFTYGRFFAFEWAKSKNKWMRRASAVSLIFPASFQELLDEVLNTADILLTDEEDIVRKGYVWMLKETSKEFPDEIYAYMMKHKDVMPRTALRYAIEKYPKAKRKEAMAK